MSNMTTIKKINRIKQSPKKEISNVHEKLAQRKVNNILQNSQCSCNICQQSLEAKERGKNFIRLASSTFKIQSIKFQQFLTLICAVNSKQYLRIAIPQICFFYKGEPKRVFNSNNSGVHQVEVTPSLKKNIEYSFLSNHRRGALQKKNESMEGINEEDAHIKHFSTIIPSIKHGEVKISEKQMKRAETYIFHNDPHIQQAPIFESSHGSPEQICLTKFKDGKFDLFNQKQLRQTLKSLLSLSQIEFIQKYIKPNEKQDEILQIEYDELKVPENQLMYKRSLVHVKTDVKLINKLSKDYLSIENLQSYQALLVDSPSQYCQYQTYKMIHYMQLMKNVKIQKLFTLWMKDETDSICFIGLEKFQWHENAKFVESIENISELNELVNIKLTDFQEELLNAWEIMKQKKQKLESKLDVDLQKQERIKEIKKQSALRIMETSKNRKR